MRIFLSFHKNQEVFGKHLMNSLWKSGIEPVSVDLFNLLSIEIFNTNKLIKATKHLDFVISVISKDYVNDPWLIKELHMFKSLGANRGESSFVIPVILDTCKIPDIFDANIAKRFDFKKQFDDPFDKLVKFIVESRRVFIVMKMTDDELELVYRDAIIPAIEQSKYSKLRIDDFKDSEKISPRILKAIQGSDVVFCDLTGERPNCYYEAGYAEALGKTVILTAKKGTTVHFDLKDNQFIFWENANDLKVKLIERFQSIAESIP